MHDTEDEVAGWIWAPVVAGCQRIIRLVDNFRMKPRQKRAIPLAVGYTRVSTVKQATEGVSLTAQRRAIIQACDDRGWILADVLSDEGASGKSMKKRPQLVEVLDRLRRGDADVLVVSKLDRLARSVFDFADLLGRATREGWAIVVLDIDVDMSKPYGKAVAQIMMTVAELERELISGRISEALQVKIADGVAVGRPHSVPPETVRHIEQLRSSGSTYRAVAAALNDAQVPTGLGAAQWSAGSVAAVLKRKRAASR